MSQNNGVDPSTLAPVNVPVAESSSTAFLRKRLTGLVYSARMTAHWKPSGPESDMDDVIASEPERPARIRAIWARFTVEGLLEETEHIRIREATKEEIMLAHSETHYQEIASTAVMTLQDLLDRTAFYSRLSLYVNEFSFECARLSCGGVIEMCRAVAEGRIRNGFCVVRPPGHHCDPEEPSGFCFINNVVVAARWLQTVHDTTIKKVLILDWDVHHGNGTQRSFYHDSSVLYISIHRFLDKNRTTYFYPGTSWGSTDNVGEGDGTGFNVNVAWPDAGMSDKDYIFAFQRAIMPIATEFNPDFVLVSAGFDAAVNDPLGESNVTPEGYAYMTYQLSALAGGKVVLALEGGYHLESTASSALECVKVLLGQAPPRIPPMTASVSATEAVDDVLKVHSKYWKCLPQTVSFQDSEEEGKVIPLADVLQMHRQYDLYHHHGLCTVPIADDRLKKHYQHGVMVSEDVYRCETLVLFIHDLGNVRNEIPCASANAELERSYLIDCNTQVTEWVKHQDWGIIDVQILPFHFPTPGNGRAVHLGKRTDKLSLMQSLVHWIWAQFIAMADCENIVMIALGDGCAPLIDLVNTKVTELKPKLRAIVQLPGFNQVPMMRWKSEQAWYRDHSLILIPKSHPFHPVDVPTGISVTKYGNIITSDQSRPTTVLKAEWGQISEFLSLSIEATKSAVKVGVDGDQEMADGVPAIRVV